jgi:D-amino-acid dehydrogenase
MTNRHVVVVGAGIVGIACASYLQRAGCRVTIIDYRAPGEGCSFGNAGIVAPGACLPLAMPGIWMQIPKFLIDPLGPLSIRLRHAPSIVPWIVRWLRSSSTKRVTSISRAMRALHVKAFEAYLAFFPQDVPWRYEC